MSVTNEVECVVCHELFNTEEDFDYHQCPDNSHNLICNVKGLTIVRYKGNRPVYGTNREAKVDITIKIPW